MKRIRLVSGGVMVAAVLLLSGCLRFSDRLVVESDGSATLYRSVQVSTIMTDMMSGMGGGTSEGVTPDAADLEMEARQMGPGVSLVSLEEFEDEWGPGYTVVFDVEDVEDLAWTAGPGSSVPDTGGMGGMADMGDPDTFAFEFDPGRTAILRIFAPDTETEEDMDPEELEEVGELTNEDMAMFSMFYTGMRIQMTIEVEGSIVSTNAAHRDGSEITLLDIEVDRLLRDPRQFRRFMEFQEVAPDPAILSELDGVRLETQPEVEVRFR